MTIDNILKDLVPALKNVKDYRYAWTANIAMSFKDEISRYRKKTGKRYLNKNDYHTIANNAANNFIDLLIKD